MLCKRFPILLLALGVLLQASPAPLRALSLASTGLVQLPIPFGTRPVPVLTQADLDANGTPETLALTAGRLSVISGNSTVWQSPSDWRVVQAAFSDLDRDGKPEVTLLLWRPFRPWPTDQWLPNGGRIDSFHNTAGRSCHIILIGWIRGGYHELWAGSAMADPLISFSAADVNGDGLQELVALEGRYTGLWYAPARTLKVWEWNSFGFSAVSSMDGTFSKMTLVQAGHGRILILVP